MKIPRPLDSTSAANAPLEHGLAAQILYSTSATGTLGKIQSLFAPIEL